MAALQGRHLKGPYKGLLGKSRAVRQHVRHKYSHCQVLKKGLSVKESDKDCGAPDLRMEPTETASVDAIIEPKSAACCLQANKTYILHIMKRRVVERVMGTLATNSSMEMHDLQTALSEIPNFPKRHSQLGQSKKFYKQLNVSKEALAIIKFLSSVNKILMIQSG